MSTSPRYPISLLRPVLETSQRAEFTDEAIFSVFEIFQHLFRIQKKRGHKVSTSPRPPNPIFRPVLETSQRAEFTDEAIFDEITFFETFFDHLKWEKKYFSL